MSNPMINRLSGPPRYVPFTLVARLMFGGFLNQFGWIFLGVGMAFVWVFAFTCNPMEWIQFRGELETAKGKVTSIEKTNASEGGSEHSDGTPIYKFNFVFSENGNEHRGFSYATGKRKRVNSRVTIQYPKGNPELSRIKGMRTAIFGPFVLFVVLFPMIGGIIVLCGLRYGWKATRLLRYGEVAMGIKKSMEATSMEVNDHMVYKMTFAFVSKLGRQETCVVKTHRTELLEDDAQEPLLYDPMNPSYSTMLDLLPGSPNIDHNGAIQQKVSLLSLLVLIIPAISIIGHGIYVFYRFF